MESSTHGDGGNYQLVHAIKIHNVGNVNVMGVWKVCKLGNVRYT